MASELVRVETLFLIAFISLLTLLFYPALIPSFVNNPPKLHAEQFQSVPKNSIYMRKFYDIEEWLKNIKPQLSGQLIVHGIRKPQPPQRSLDLQRLNLFHELLQRRQWPRFSPEPGPRVAGGELANVLPPSASVPSSNSKNKKQSGHLIKNLYRGGYVWAHPEICRKNSSEDGAADIQLVIIVMSSPLNLKARTAIRMTWGNDARRFGVVFVFLLGRPLANKLDDLMKEDELHGDLIVNYMQDSHINTTLKTISLLEWVDAICARARFVLKTNDDVFVNVPRLIDIIIALSNTNETKTIWGKLMKNNHLEGETQSSPYYLSFKEFPNGALPDFMLGAAYLLSSDAIRPLLKKATDLPFFRLADVFVTGTLANAVGVRRVHVDDFFKYNASQFRCDKRRAIAFEKVRHKDMLQLWQQIQQCTVFKIKIVPIASNITKISKLKNKSQQSISGII